MKFVFASLCISIALFQVASATTCTLPQGTYGGTTALGDCTSDYWSSPHEPPRYCTVAQVPKLYCLSGASGTPSTVGLACPADKALFTGGTFCTLVQVYVKATFTGITKTEMADNALALKTVIATKVQAINAVMKKVTLITVLTGHILVNGVPSSASSMFHFSFLATAMSVVAMVYSKL